MPKEKLQIDKETRSSSNEIDEILKGVEISSDNELGKASMNALRQFSVKS